MKNKKITIDITILHQRTKNYDKMMFGCTVTAWDKDGQRRKSFWANVCTFCTKTNF